MASIVAMEMDRESGWTQKKEAILGAKWTISFRID